MRQAIILAAGRGRRLIPLTDTTPKCLVEVNGVPIIFNTLDTLAKYNFKKVVIVIGHLAEKVKAKIGNSWKGMQIIYVENRKYNQTNNIYSLWLARDYLNVDTVLMECDIFFEEKLIEKCLSKEMQNAVIVDRFVQGMDGTVVEIDKDKKIVKMIPGRDQDEKFDFSNKYKTVNIYYFTKEFLKKYFVPNLDLYIRTQGAGQYYELLLAVLIYFRYPPLYATIINNIKWMEIDDFSDLKRAEYLFADQKERLKLIARIHGGYWRYNFQDFSYLYNLYFPPSSFINETKINLKEVIVNYPSAQRELVDLLSNWVGIKSKFLVLANGASEIIRVINNNIVKKITIPLPTFNEYENTLEKEQINYFYRDYSNFKLNLDNYIKSVKESKSNVALLINPNNPTSQFTNLNDVKYLLKHLSAIDLFILDESFVDFVPGVKEASLEREFDKFKNLIIVKSLGKTLGVLGLRLGYALSSNEKMINLMREKLPIWNVNSVAEYFLEWLPKYREAYKSSCLKVMDDTNYLYKKLLSVKNIEPFPPSANFVLAKLTGKINSTQLRDLLFLKGNILIKDCSSKTGLSNKYVRIAARKKEETDYLISKLEELSS